MGLQERCLQQRFNSNVSPIYVDGKPLSNCPKCSYDPENNGKCSGYRGSRMIILDVKKKRNMFGFLYIKFQNLKERLRHNKT